MGARPRCHERETPVGIRARAVDDPRGVADAELPQPADVAAWNRNQLHFEADRWFKVRAEESSDYGRRGRPLLRLQGTAGWIRQLQRTEERRGQCGRQRAATWLANAVPVSCSHAIRPEFQKGASR